MSLLTWAQEGFAYAEAFEEKEGRYRGLRAGQQLVLSSHAPSGLLVQPEVALKQLTQTPLQSGASTPSEKPTDTATLSEETEGASPAGKTGEEMRVLRRFHGTVSLDPARVGRDAGRIAEEVVAHLLGLPQAEVRVSLEIEAVVPQGVPENVVRIVTENCRTLKFENHGFERE